MPRLWQKGMARQPRTLQTQPRLAGTNVATTPQISRSREPRPLRAPLALTRGYFLAETILPAFPVQSLLEAMAIPRLAPIPLLSGGSRIPQALAALLLEAGRA